uniref:Uncharacterized protein n=1 Tax=Trichobilharzia regenti TaxID=157069 RepID=A0AA85JGI1_TRIRE|nr:unnamed protein product [Trichobilharzia regenti]
MYTFVLALSRYFGVASAGKRMAYRELQPTVYVYLDNSFCVSPRFNRLPPVIECRTSLSPFRVLVIANLDNPVWSHCLFGGCIVSCKVGRMWQWLLFFMMVTTNSKSLHSPSSHLF